MSSQPSERFNSFAEFYPYYLEEHRNPTCRRLHYAGSLLVLVVLGYALLSGQSVSYTHLTLPTIYSV